MAPFVEVGELPLNTHTSLGEDPISSVECEHTGRSTFSEREHAAHLGRSSYTGTAAGPCAHDYVVRSPRSGVLLFNNPNFCGQGIFAAPLLVLLPARAHKNITFHTYPYPMGFQPQRWDTRRMFEYDAAAGMRARRAMRPRQNQDAQSS